MTVPGGAFLDWRARPGVLVFLLRSPSIFLRMAWERAVSERSQGLEVCIADLILLLLLLTPGGDRAANLAVMTLDGSWNAGGWLSWAVDE